MGFFNSNKYTIYYSGNEKFKTNGVAIILNRKVIGTVLGNKPVSDRIISLIVQGYPVNYSVIQVYSPTSDAKDKDIQDFYDQLQQVIDTATKGDALFIIEGFNLKMGDKADIGIVGKHGLGSRSSAGERLIEFCAANNFFITNTFLQQPKCIQYTWVSPIGQHRNQ